MFSVLSFPFFPNGSSLSLRARFSLGMIAENREDCFYVTSVARARQLAALRAPKPRQREPLSWPALWHASRGVKIHSSGDAILFASPPSGAPCDSASLCLWKRQ